jgi:hypothetical protein
MGKYKGYWKRGDHQFWHFTDKGACLLNTAKPNYHYNGDGHIFFKPTDPMSDSGLVECTKEEFDKAKNAHIKKLKSF